MVSAISKVHTDTVMYILRDGSQPSEFRTESLPLAYGFALCTMGKGKEVSTIYNTLKIL